jgi:hypothetical protein
MLKLLKSHLRNNLASNDRRRMILPPLEPAYRDESNDGGFILLRPLDAEIFGKTSNGAVSQNAKCRFVDVLLNISASSCRRRMKLLSLDSFR